MRHWTHDELHMLIDGNPELKEKSNEIHALSKINLDKKEMGKLRMMEIYAGVVNCRRIHVAKEFVKRAFSCVRRGEALDELRKEYALQELCHSPFGNDYVCFCNER